MLRNDLTITASLFFNVHIIQRGVTYRYHREMPYPLRRRQTEYLG